MTSTVLAIAPAAALANDLLVLNGDSVTLSGSQQYGLVYVDGDLRLAGDTSITGTSIYLGPHAAVISCFVAGSGDNGCTAGRSLTLVSSGALTVATGIDLTAGTGTVRPGGTLSLSGGPVTVGGDINTSGSGGAASGSVSISSTGSLATGAISAPGAAVTLTASGPIDVGNGIETQGTSDVLATDPTRVQSAGPVVVDSSGGNVRIDGQISANGRDAPTGGLGGGYAAAVSISGADVRTASIDTTGGRSAGSEPGGSAPISITGTGAVSALGRLDASGQDGAGTSGTPGAPITLKAGGPLTVGGDVSDGGGPSAAGGTITLTGASADTAQLLAPGGDGTSATPMGGPGGTVTVTAPGGASLGNVLAYGGATPGAAAAGNGGTISVSSPSGSIATGQVQTQGGSQNDGPGAPGGPITLAADGDLTVGGTLSSNGSDAGGSADPPAVGGHAGAVTLRADTGRLTLGGNAGSQGGAGATAHTSGALGGSGGSGGQVVIVAHGIGALASLSSAGGPGGGYGSTQGPGGPGGAIQAWTNAPIFNAQQLVSSDGGDGNPTGVAGHQSQDSSPTALTVAPATGVLSFTSASPEASGYHVLMSVGGGALSTALTTTATSGLQPAAPLCQPVAFTVVAVNDVIGWTSDPSAAVAYTRQPSATQGCSAAPKVSAAAPLRLSRRRLRRAGWAAALRLTSSGIGQLRATLERTVVTTPITGSGPLVLRLRLPAAGRAIGRDRLQVTTTSPDGKGHLTSVLVVRVTR